MNTNRRDHPQSEWYTRGYLPHRDRQYLLQSITFRLADSLPQEKIEFLDQELKRIPEKKRNTVRRRKIESWIDAGMGCCALRHPEVAKYFQDTLLHFHRDRYILRSWCIMPNHVHVVAEIGTNLSAVVQGWKSFSSRWVLAQNERLKLKIPNPNQLWIREYWDRYIRDEKHLESAISYIHQNPVKAGLCESAATWQWSSANSENADLVEKAKFEW